MGSYTGTEDDYEHTAVTQAVSCCSAQFIYRRTVAVQIRHSKIYYKGGQAEEDLMGKAFIAGKEENDYHKGREDLEG